MSQLGSRIGVQIYLVIFFAYLLGPLVIMSVTAFNSSSFPSAMPWECLTFDWFRSLLQDSRIMNGIRNSILIGAGTVVLSVLMGLSGALVLMRIWPRLRATYYTIVIAPILIPGVVLGISTLVFWDRINRLLGLGPGSVLSNGLFLTILGQSTFIASYCMLVMVARLQRYDETLSEAALDLGATPAQVFRKILLPFMRPAIVTAAVLAFLASFENYNTTTFIFGEYPTLTIELSQKVRYGVTPAVSALAFIIVALTIFIALANEAIRRRRELVAAVRSGASVTVAAGGRVTLPRIFSGNISAVLVVAMAMGTIVMIGTASVYRPDQCIADLRQEKQLAAQKRAEELRRQRDAKTGGTGENVGIDPVTSPAAPPRSQGGGFETVFDPGVLQELGN
ncbi:MAG: ABC transporter permease [Rhodobacteraceae bacterium]|jgi:spermidine/putrescine transport system permease protein|nr:ABC transporter permease [Paracoccaceae bacterium]